MKILVISGTPGTGKTLISERLSQIINSRLISLNKIAVERKFYTKYDSDRDTYVIDEEKIIKHAIEVIQRYNQEDINYILIEGHISDLIPDDLIDIAIILRCHPDELIKRLKERGYSKEKIIENVQCEILGNSVNDFLQKNVKCPILEINTTNLEVEKVVNIIREILTGARDITQYYLGTIDWLEDLFQNNRLSEFFD